MKILFVDDEENFILPYRDILEMRGYDVRFYTSVNKLLGALNKEPDPSFDIGVVDLMMPLNGFFTERETHKGMSTGVALVKWLRKNYLSLADMPVLFLTNLEKNTAAGEKAYNEVVELGHAEWVSKARMLPSELEVMIRKMAKEK